MTKSVTINKEVKNLCSGCKLNSAFEICYRMGEPCPHLGKPTCEMAAGSITVTVPMSAKVVIDVK